MKRQDSPLYWLDSDYLVACTAVVAMLVFDLFQRRFAKAWELALLGAIGGADRRRSSMALAGRRAGRTVVESAGPSAGGHQRSFQVEQLVTNWPNFLPSCQRSRGLGPGAGGRRGRLFRTPWTVRSLARGCFCTWGWAGWHASRLFPVLLAVRMTPPRGDDWAGILGVFLGALAWCRHERLTPVAIAMLISAARLAGSDSRASRCLSWSMVAPGNPNLVQDPTIVDILAPLAAGQLA